MAIKRFSLIVWIIIPLIGLSTNSFSEQSTGRTVADLFNGIENEDLNIQKQSIAYFTGIVEASMLHGMRPDIWCPNKLPALDVLLSNFIEDVEVLNKYGHSEIMNMDVSVALSKFWDMRYACPERQAAIKEKAKRITEKNLDKLWEHNKSSR